MDLKLSYKNAERILEVEDGEEAQFDTQTK